MTINSQRDMKVVIFGNSASGKSTFAKKLAKQYQLAHLDLDTLAWLPASSPETPPQRQDIAVSVAKINDFISQQPSWVIEGCYSDLLSHTLELCTEVVFLNLPVEDCITNAKNRPWEPHKYHSKAEQDANLPMLIDWIAQYESRDDTFSKSAHQSLYAKFNGKKIELTENNQ